MEKKIRGLRGGKNLGYFGEEKICYVILFYMKVSWRKDIYWFSVNHPVWNSTVHVNTPQLDDVTVVNQHCIPSNLQY